MPPKIGGKLSGDVTSLKFPLRDVDAIGACLRAAALTGFALPRPSRARLPDGRRKPYAAGEESGALQEETKLRVGLEPNPPVDSRLSRGQATAPPLG